MPDSCESSPKNLPLYWAEQWYRSLFIEKEGLDNTYASEVLGKNANECTKQEIKTFQMFSNINKIINLQK